MNVSTVPSDGSSVASGDSGSVFGGGAFGLEGEGDHLCGGVGGQGHWCVELVVKLLLLSSSSSSSSEDEGMIGICTELSFEGLGTGGAIIGGLVIVLFGKEDSSKVTSVDTLIVWVFLSQSLYPFE